MSTTNQSKIVPKKVLVTGASGLLGGQRLQRVAKRDLGINCLCEPALTDAAAAAFSTSTAVQTEFSHLTATEWSYGRVELWTD
jgi:hypothetical protein